MLRAVQLPAAVRAAARMIHRTAPSARCSTAASEFIFDVDETNFEEKVLKAGKPVIVQAHATWCGPCQMLKPRLNEVVEEMKGEVLLAQMDVDQCPNLAQALKVTGVPAVYGLIGDKLIDRFTGLRPKGEVAQWARRVVDAAAEAGKKEPAE